MKITDKFKVKLDSLEGLKTRGKKKSKYTVLETEAFAPSLSKLHIKVEMVAFTYLLIYSCQNGYIGPI